MPSALPSKRRVAPAPSPLPPSPSHPLGNCAAEHPSFPVKSSRPRGAGVEPYAENIRAALAAGADVVHVKFRGRSLTEYLEQFDAFAEQVVPLVNEG